MQQPSAVNPFFHRGRPVRDMAYFFGRQQETAKAVGLLTHGQSLAVVGPRRIGKTSFLNRIMTEPALSTKYTISLDGTLCNTLTALEFFGLLLDELTDITNNDAPPTNGAVAGDPFAALTKTVRALHRDGSTILILIDEFEALSQNPNLDEGFFSQLRGLAMQFDVTYVTASAQPLLALTYADASALSSPFFNIFAPIQLGLFSEVEAKQMLARLSTHAGDEFSPEIIETILDWSGPHPLLLQIAGYYALEAVAGASGASEDGRGAFDLASAHANFVQDAQSHWLYAWRQLGSGEQRLLALLSAAEADPPQAIRQLEAVGLARRTAAGYAPLSSAFATFVNSQPVEGVLQAPPFTLVPEERLVRLRGEPIHLPPTEFRLLHVLLESAGSVVSYGTLSQQIWPDDVQHEPDMERIKTAVKMLRRGLGADKECIQNVARRGYQFVGR